MSDNPLPPVRLRPEAELARDALATELIARAARLALWASPGTPVTPGGALDATRLHAAAAELGLADDADGSAAAGRAWRVALDAGLVLAGPRKEGGGDTVIAGGSLSRLTRGAPGEILELWLDVLERVVADAGRGEAGTEDSAGAAGTGNPEGLDGLEGTDGLHGLGGRDRPAGLDRAGAGEFLDGVLGNLYLLTAGEGGPDDGPVPLPALAASMIVPEGMTEPTDDVLEQVSEAMLRLDGPFRALQSVGLVEYRPVDEALKAEGHAEVPDGSAGTSDAPAGGEKGAGERGTATHAGADTVDDSDVVRYGMVRLTPLGRFGLRRRLLKAGYDAPVVGALADRDADALLHGTAGFPPAAAHDEIEQWLARRVPLDGARELLAAARGGDDGAPLRRLHCQQALSLVGREAEPALRDVLDDPELGGLARVWLTEQGAADVPPPTERMIFWLTVDTLAAQLAAEGTSAELEDLVEGLARQHGGFFDTAWRVDHPATARVLDVMGRLHPDKRIAKQARTAAFKARSQHGG